MVRKLPKYLFAHPSQLTHDTQTGPQVAQQQPPRTDKHVRFLTSDGVVAGGVYGPAPPPAPTPQFNWCSPAARPPATVPKKSQRRKVVADSPAPKTSLGGKNSLDGKNNLRGRNWNWWVLSLLFYKADLCLVPGQMGMR